MTNETTPAIYSRKLSAIQGMINNFLEFNPDKTQVTLSKKDYEIYLDAVRLNNRNHAGKIMYVGREIKCKDGGLR